MTIVFPFALKEIDRLRNLLIWIKELEPLMPRHRAVLLSAASVKKEVCVELGGIITPVFGSVTLIRQSVEDERPWPMCCNAMFRVAENYIRNSTEHKGPWFWCESDCIPLRKGWLDAIEDQYIKGGKPFMGCLYDQPYSHINGVMVYPKMNRYNPMMSSADTIPWDCVAPKVTLRHAQPTKLIQRSLVDGKLNQPHSFAHEADLSIIWPDCVLFHGCKDGSLIELLRWRNKSSPSPPPKAKASKVIKKTVKAILQGKSAFYHSGNFGDIVYALYAIKLAGGGSLTIGPEQCLTFPCSQPIRRRQYDLFESFIKEQPYITDVSYSDHHPGKGVHFDLNEFRNNWESHELRQRTGIYSLAKMHAYTLGVDHLFNEEDVWLTVKQPIFHGMICVHRSHRYRVQNFPWKEVIKRYGKDLLFVGLEREHADFCIDVGTNISFWHAKDLLEVARLIAGGRAFIGNQSFPCSVALGLCMTVLQETWYPRSPDCMFDRPNFFNQRSKLEDFEAWL